MKTSSGDCTWILPQIAYSQWASMLICLVLFHLMDAPSPQCWMAERSFVLLKDSVNQIIWEAEWGTSPKDSLIQQQSEAQWHSKAEVMLCDNRDRRFLDCSSRWTTHDVSVTEIKIATGGWHTGSGQRCWSSTSRDHCGGFFLSKFPSCKQWWEWSHWDRHNACQVFFLQWAFMTPVHIDKTLS